MMVSVIITLWFSGIMCYVVWYTVMPQYPRFTAAQKKKLES
jgi:phage shock protein PspC (stress-responsive transcriptional regulator)